MTSLELLKLLGNAQDSYIMDSRKRPKRPQRPPLAKILAAAACAALLIGAGTFTVLQKPWAQRAETPESSTLEASPSPSAAVSSTSTADPLGTVSLLAASKAPAAPTDITEHQTAWTERHPSEDTAYSMEAFSYQLAAQVLSSTQESVCLSPLALYEGLSVVASGSQGTTQEQLLSLLGQPDLDALKDQAQRLYEVNQLNYDPNLLQLSNSLWLDEKDQSGQGIGFHQDWVLDAAENYYCDVYAADFGSPDTTKALAAWISKNTGGLLDHQLSTLELPSDTVMAVASTVWYRSQWDDNFDESNTAPDTFTTQQGETVTCDFMHQTQEGGQVVDTDTYTKSYLSLTSYGRVYFVLPKDGVDLDTLLTEESLWSILESDDYTDADVIWSVPKFTTDSALNLGDTLQALGITEAFNPNAADFSTMADTPLYLSQVTQGTHISLTEHGVEAASYNLAAMMAGAAEPEELPQVEMNLNRPFLYLITASDGSPLFIGVVRTPEG